MRLTAGLLRRGPDGKAARALGAPTPHQGRRRLWHCRGRSSAAAGVRLGLHGCPRPDALAVYPASGVVPQRDVADH